MKKVVYFFILLAFFLSTSAALAAHTDYLVGGGDILKVTVYDHPDLDTTVRVTSDGTIPFPLVGQVQIGGLPVSQVAETLAEMLANGYIIDPQVSVFVEEFRSKKVIIMGQVENPGLYELNGPTTLLELISKAGGMNTESGDNVTIKRKAFRQKPEDQFITINVKNLLEKGDAALDVPIMDGDSVFVAKAGMFYVTGEVNKPYAYKLEEGTSVIKAITMAGGFTDLASKGKIRILRKIDGAEKVLKDVSMHTPVLANDVIVVPESFF
jgi:polysaccharide biosynthesis/export protein